MLQYRCEWDLVYPIMFVTNASTSIIYYVRRFFFEWMGGEVARSFEDSYLKWAEMTKTYECKQESARCLCSVLLLHAAIAFEPHIFVLCLYFTLAEAQQRKFRPLNLTSVHKHPAYF